MRRPWGGVVAAVSICVLIGCGKSDGPALAPAKGVVTLDGKPLASARVSFHPKDKAARYSYGTTDADGRFQMSTFGMNDGALVGSHTVTISKVDLPEEATKIDVEALKSKGYGGGGMPGYESMMGLGGGKKLEIKQEVPKKYSDKEASEIEAVVTVEGPNEFTFNLQK